MKTLAQFRRGGVGGGGGGGGLGGNWGGGGGGGGAFCFLAAGAGALFYCCVRGRHAPCHSLTGAAPEQSTHSKKAPTTTKKTRVPVCMVLGFRALGFEGSKVAGF